MGGGDNGVARGNIQQTIKLHSLDKTVFALRLLHLENAYLCVGIFACMYASICCASNMHAVSTSFLPSSPQISVIPPPSFPSSSPSAFHLPLNHAAFCYLEVHNKKLGRNLETGLLRFIYNYLYEYTPSM